MKTMNTGDSIIDGPTTSSTFIIKSIMTEDVSQSLMMAKIMKDDAEGHSHGWNPDGHLQTFYIIDEDVATTKFVELLAIGTTVTYRCHITAVYFNRAFSVDCSGDPTLYRPPEGAEIRYIIINPPTKIETSVIDTAEGLSASSSKSSTYGSTTSSSPQSNSSNNLESVRSHDQIASEFP